MKFFDFILRIITIKNCWFIIILKNSRKFIEFYLTFNFNLLLFTLINFIIILIITITH